jgi:FkbM family methyltransferase
MFTTRIFKTRYGQMHLIDDEPWISRSLREQGEWSESEMDVMRTTFEILKPLYPDGVEVVDAGAYIGDLTIPLAQLECVKKVYAFEPQPEIRDILEKNLALNSITNVEVMPYALGHMNGPISFTPNDALHSPGSTQMRSDDSGEIKAEMRTLDSFNLNPQFIKADVEGMEVFLLNGAQETLKRSGPIVFYERDTMPIPNIMVPGEGEGLQQQFKMEWDDLFRSLGYFIYHKLTCPIFNPKNFNKAPNTFGNYASLMGLAVPLFGPNGKIMLEEIRKSLLC